MQLSLLAGRDPIPPPFPRGGPIGSPTCITRPLTPASHTGRIENSMFPRLSFFAGPDFGVKMKIVGRFSEWKLTGRSVPRGSVLAPLLYTAVHCVCSSHT
jgi:hypothetical protein